MPLVDFDRLKDQALKLLVEVEGKAAADGELQKLRGDYLARTAGMLKAVAAASRRQGALAAVLVEIEQLSSLDADALILAYTRAAARFRDTFRSSFAPLGGSSRPAVKAQEYK
ncbi:MAG: hypothetical protein ABIE70_04460 [bacterium]